MGVGSEEISKVKRKHCWGWLPEFQAQGANLQRDIEAAGEFPAHVHAADGVIGKRP